MALRAALGLLACGLAALAYQNTFDNPFVFDDRETVLLNPSLIAAWDWRAAAVHNLARPVVNLSYALDRALWGFTSFGFHVTNVVLHITAVGLFYGWCSRALSDGARLGSGPSRARAADASDAGLAPAWGAFCAAGIFALHPVMSAAVGYISARSELLAAMGALASLTFARRAIVAANRPAAFLAVAFGALAIGSSSSAAALPLLVLAYDAWVLRDPGWALRAARIYAPATLAVAMAAAWYATGMDTANMPPRGFFEHLLTQELVTWRYLALLAVPVGQALVHQVHWVGTPFDPASFILLPLLAACITFAIWKRGRQPLVAFGVVWFVGVLAPTAIVSVRDAMAEHRLYLASGGLLLATASLAARPIAGSRVARAVLALVLAMLAVATYRRNELWSDPMKLWEESVERSPQAWQAHWGYGELLREIGRCDRAVPEYEAVLRLNPWHADARARLEACR